MPIRAVEYEFLHASSCACRPCLLSGIKAGAARRGALHTGDEVGALLMRRMPPPAPRAARLQAALAGTLGGALGVLAPLWEGADGGALLRLQALLALALPHAAGLNPAAFGCARPDP